MLRILLADDHNVLRRGLRGLLEEHREWEVCGEASTGREAVQLAVKLEPDIVIMDLSMPELNGVEATRQILKVLPHTQVLVFTMHETDQVIHDVLTAGARGYILKSDLELHLVSGVEALSRGKPFFTPQVAGTVLKGFLASKGEKEAKTAGSLSPREHEIVQLLADGRSNKEVADALNMSVRTAETHRKVIMQKLNLNTFAELVKYAIRNELVEP